MSAIFIPSFLLRPPITYAVCRLLFSRGWIPPSNIWWTGGPFVQDAAAVLSYDVSAQLHCFTDFSFYSPWRISSHLCGQSLMLTIVWFLSPLKSFPWVLRFLSTLVQRLSDFSLQTSLCVLSSPATACVSYPAPTLLPNWPPTPPCYYPDNNFLMDFCEIKHTAVANC